MLSRTRRTGTFCEPQRTVGNKRETAFVSPVLYGKDPILTPSAQVKFFDWVYFGVGSIFDVTKANGKRGGYGNRAGR